LSVGKPFYRQGCEIFLPINNQVILSKDKTEFLCTTAKNNRICGNINMWITIACHRALDNRKKVKLINCSTFNKGCWPENPWVLHAGLLSSCLITRLKTFQRRKLNSNSTHKSMHRIEGFSNFSLFFFLASLCLVLAAKWQIEAGRLQRLRRQGEHVKKRMSKCHLEVKQAALTVSRR